MTNRAVSEVIAFVLVFSIVIASVGLLYTVGFSGLGNIQESEQDRSAERAFSAVAVAFEDIQRDMGRTRAVDLELAGRSITVNQSTELTVEIDNGPSTTASGAFVYGQHRQTEIAYEGGAVIRTDGDTQFVTREPRFRCTDDHAVISVVHFTGDNPTRTVASDGSARIIATGPAPEDSIRVGSRDNEEVRVDFSNSRYADAWESYFESESQWTLNAAGTEATCDPADSVTILQVPLTLEYENVPSGN